MPKTARISLLIAGFLSITFLALYLFSPKLIKWYVSHAFPEVQVTSAKVVSYRCVEFEGVGVNTSEVKGTLTKVTACKYPKTIQVDGGSINITYSPSPSSGGSKGKGYAISAKNLSAKTVYKGISTEVSGASYSKGLACGSEAKVSKVTYQVTIKNPCYSKSGFIFDGGTIDSKLEVLGHKADTLKFYSGKVELDKNLVSVTKVEVGSITVMGFEAYLDPDFVSLDLESVEINHPKVFSTPITLKDVSIPRVDRDFPNSTLSVFAHNQKVIVNLKDKYLRVTGDCATLFDAIPKELKTSPIEEVDLTGSFSVEVLLLPEVKFNLSNKCKLKERPPFIEKLGGKFIYTAHHPKGKGTFTRESGLGSQGWVPIQSISPNMVTALTTTEDPGFFYHRGIIPQAIENSLRDNLKMGKFFRGGSTITMQLAKNLWLSRDRTLGRKVQEAILTLALEDSLPKDKILELYLNVVEYGPDLYGIGPASEKLLGKSPNEISISEALYLVLRLPAPNNSASYAQKKGLISKLLDNIAKSGKMSPDLVEVEKSLLDSVELP